MPRSVGFASVRGRPVDEGPESLGRAHVPRNNEVSGRSPHLLSRLPKAGSAAIVYGCQALAWLRAGMTRKRGPADDIQRRDAGNGGKSQSPRSLSSDCPAAVLLRAWPYRAHHPRHVPISMAQAGPTRESQFRWRFRAGHTPVRVARFLPCRGRASECAAPALRPGRARSRTSPILVPSNARIRWSACPSSGSSPWALLFSWPEHHLHATVLLVAEGFVHAGAVLKVNAMRHHERRVDLPFLDPA